MLVGHLVANWLIVVAVVAAVNVMALEVRTLVDQDDSFAVADWSVVGRMPMEDQIGCLNLVVDLWRYSSMSVGQITNEEMKR